MEQCSTHPDERENARRLHASQSLIHATWHMCINVITRQLTHAIYCEESPTRATNPIAQSFTRRSRMKTTIVHLGSASKVTRDGTGNSWWDDPFFDFRTRFSID